MKSPAFFPVMVSPTSKLAPAAAFGATLCGHRRPDAPRIISKSKDIKGEPRRKTCFFSRGVEMCSVLEWASGTLTFRWPPRASGTTTDFASQTTGVMGKQQRRPNSATTCNKKHQRLWTYSTIFDPPAKSQARHCQFWWLSVRWRCWLGSFLLSQAPSTAPPSALGRAGIAVAWDPTWARPINRQEIGTWMDLI